MARMKNVNGVNVPFTPEEETAKDVQEAQSLSEKPMNDWKASMQETDAGMPRYLEDLITINSLTMTSEMKVRYDAKIKIRGEQP